MKKARKPQHNQPKVGGDPNYLLKDPAYRRAQRRLIRNGNPMANYLLDQVK